MRPNAVLDIELSQKKLLSGNYHMFLSSLFDLQDRTTVVITGRIEQRTQLIRS
jgi:hypothetical protein